MLFVMYRKNPWSEFSSRFSGKVDGVNAVLTISGVQAENAAVYYYNGYDKLNGTWVSTHWFVVVQKPPSVRLQEQ